jgi:hypothetical protein
MLQVWEQLLLAVYYRSFKTLRRGKLTWMGLVDSLSAIQLFERYRLAIRYRTHFTQTKNLLNNRLENHQRASFQSPP